MLKLTAYNEILPKLGEHQVTSTDSKSPTLAIIAPQLDAQVRNVLTRGWWFNTYQVTLYPDSERQIAVPQNTLRFTPDRGYDCVVRGEWMFNPANQSAKFNSTVKGEMVQNLDFEELPESVAQYCLYSALVIIYGTDIGLEEVVNLWRGMESDALASMTSEHLKNKRYSIRNSPRYLKLRRSMWR